MMDRTPVSGEGQRPQAKEAWVHPLSRGGQALFLGPGHPASGPWPLECSPGGGPQVSPHRLVSAGAPGPPAASLTALSSSKKLGSGMTLLSIALALDSIAAPPGAAFTCLVSWDPGESREGLKFRESVERGFIRNPRVMGRSPAFLDRVSEDMRSRGSYASLQSVTDNLCPIHTNFTSAVRLRA